VARVARDVASGCARSRGHRIGAARGRGTGARRRANGACSAGERRAAARGALGAAGARRIAHGLRRPRGCRAGSPMGQARAALAAIGALGTRLVKGHARAAVTRPAVSRTFIAVVPAAVVRILAAVDGTPLSAGADREGRPRDVARLDSALAARAGTRLGRIGCTRGVASAAIALTAILSTPSAGAHRVGRARGVAGLGSALPERAVTHLGPVGCA
jgi:hypothetical protein